MAVFCGMLTIPVRSTCFFKLIYLHISTFCHDGYVMWLNSRSSLPASALCAICHLLASDVAENFGGGFLYRVCRPVNDCELIPTVKMQTRHPVEGSFGNEFLSICIYCGVMVACTVITDRPGGAVVQWVRRLGLRSTGRKFKSCSRWRCVTTLGKLFTPMCPCHQAV